MAVGDPRTVGEEALDVETLKDVSATTGGVYSHATDRSQLAEIYRHLDHLETRRVQKISHHPRRDIYWWALAAGLFVSFAQQGIQLAQIRIGASASRSHAATNQSDERMAA